jgi:hypothetical protein
MPYLLPSSTWSLSCLSPPFDYYSTGVSLLI